MASETASAPDQRERVTDWEAIEREYRGGQLSEAEIARQYNISRAAIQKRAKKNGWSRDLTDKVRQEVAARLVADGLQHARGSATIELAAERGVQLVRGHRSKIAATFEAVAALIHELQSVTCNLNEIEDAIHEETADDENGKRRARMLAAVALPSRAQVAGTLATALRTLIPLERQAFNLDDKGELPQSETLMIATGMTAQEAAEAYARTVRSE